MEQEKPKAETPEKTEEEKKEEKTEEGKTDPEPPAPVILYVDLHCAGCARKIERSIMRMKGVEGVVVDMAHNQVTLTGPVDPHAICDRITKKTKRRAKVVSPLPPPPPPEGEQLLPPLALEVVNSRVSEQTTVELNVNMHCEACAEQLKHKILKMKGVEKVVTELGSGKVTVMGTMDANKLVDYVYRRTKKQAKIVPQPEPEPEPQKGEDPKKVEEKPAEQGKEDDKNDNGDKKDDGGKPEEEAKEGGEEKGKDGGQEEGNKEGDEYGLLDEESMKKMVYYYQPLYVVERIPPPQLFSDENPNACSIS